MRDPNFSEWSDAKCKRFIRWAMPGFVAPSKGVSGNLWIGWMQLSLLNTWIDAAERVYYSLTPKRRKEAREVWK